jgi:hypothetical protein
MPYMPHYKHDIRCGGSSETTAQALAKATDKPAALLAIIAEREASDTDGIASLITVLEVCRNAKFAGQPLSSVRARVLKLLPAGWRVDSSLSCLCYLISPGKSRIHLPDGILDAGRVERANTCYGEAAVKRLEGYKASRAKVRAIAEAMMSYVSAAKHLHSMCDDATGLEYDPMTAAGIMVADA